MKKLSIAVAGIASVCLWFGISATAHAQEASVAAQNQEAVASYEFVAQPGNSMSVMARRAVQLYDEQSADISLPEPCIIAAETKIVQASNPRHLAIGENVRFDGSVVAEQARIAATLTEDQKAAWSVYSNNANFDTSNVKLAKEVAAQSQTANPQQPNAGTEQSSEQSSSQNKPAENTNQTTDGSAPWYWWVVGIGTIAALYYLLGGKPKTTPDSTK